MNASRTHKVGAGWFLLFTLAWLAIWTVQLTPVQLLLPDQLDTPGAAGTWVYGVVYSGVVLGVGGLAGIVAGPLSGALSDRTRTPWGRRRPWAAGASWLTAVCLLLTGLAQGPWLIGLAWTGVSIGIAVASAAFTALIADQLPNRSAAVPRPPPARRRRWASSWASVLSCCSGSPCWPDISLSRCSSPWSAR